MKIIAEFGTTTFTYVSSKKQHEFLLTVILKYHAPTLFEGEWGPELARVASVSVRFRRKERGTRVKDREKSGASKRAGRGGGRKEGNACRQTPGF